MDIKESEQKLHQVDSFLTTLTKILKKHWFILLIILLGYGVYAIVTSDEFNSPAIEEVQVYDSLPYGYGDYDTIYEDEFDSTEVE